MYHFIPVDIKIILRREHCNPHLLGGKNEAWSDALSQAKRKGCS